MVAQHATAGGGACELPAGATDKRRRSAEKQKTVRPRTAQGRTNEPCPCGSGKKYKKCHGATAVA